LTANFVHYDPALTVTPVQQRHNHTETGPSPICRFARLAGSNLVV
jgi:hypothetical protein